MGCCERLAPMLLVHVNLLLCVAAGAGLATAARLKWDPSTYVAVRALFPLEYRVAAGALGGAGAALLALAHVAALALAARARRPRLARSLLITYAVAMACLACAQAAWATWTGARLAAWLRSERAARVLEMLELRNHLRPLLAFLARYHPLPEHLKDLMEEAEADVPRNVYVCVAAALLTAVLQPAAALLALLSAARAAPDSINFSIASADCEKAPLKTAYRNGQLVIV